MTTKRPRPEPANDNIRILGDDPHQIFEFRTRQKPEDDDTPIGRHERTPQERAAARERVALKVKAQAEAMAPIREALKKRQGKSDPSCPANDNEDFPLLAVLRRDNVVAFIRTVMDYRQLVALCEAQPLQGLDYQRGNGVGGEFESSKLRGTEDIDKAAADGWPTIRIPGGEIRYKGLRKSRGAYPLPARRATPIDASRQEDGLPGQVSRTAPLAKPFNERLLLAAIDARPVLAELRMAMGALVDPFEDAVLGARTFTQIGRADGHPTKPDVAGKAMVYRALHAVDGAWHDVVVRQRREEQEAERRVRLERDRLAKVRDEFVRRAA